MTIAVLGIDLGKNSCSLVGLDASGRVMTRAASARAVTTLDSIKRSLVGLRMPRALEVAQSPQAAGIGCPGAEDG